MITLQQNQGTKSGTTGPLSYNLAAAPINGNLLIAWISANSTVAYPTVSSIVTTGVTWTEITHENDTAGGKYLTTSMWKGVIGSGATVATAVTFANTILDGANVSICEFAGVSSTGDITATVASGISTSPSTTAYSIASAYDLIVVCLGYMSSTAPSGQPGGTFSNATF